MTEVTVLDFFSNPRKSWETDSELFYTLLSEISGSSNVDDIFSYFSVCYPIGSKIPRYITSRLGGTYGTLSQKNTELEILSKHGIIRKETFELKSEPIGFQGWSYCITGESFIDILPEGNSISDLILSLENCIQNRNKLRVYNNIPPHRLIRGKLVYDEFVMILQILRAKLIMKT